jgi:hypothetical protein
MFPTNFKRKNILVASNIDVTQYIDDDFFIDYERLMIRYQLSQEI